MKLSLRISMVLLTTTFAIQAFAGNHLKILASRDEDLQARVDLIQQAKKEILIEYYEVDEDLTSLLWLSLLCEASKRGVKVQIILDSYTHKITKQMLAALLGRCADSKKKQNVSIREYNPVNPFFLPGATHRNHSKLLNVDGNKMIVGGRNARRGYFMLEPVPTDNFRDIDLLVYGDAVLESKKDFKRLWFKNNSVHPVNLYDFSQKQLKIKCAGAENSLTCESNRQRNLILIREASSRLQGMINSLKGGSLGINVNYNTRTGWYKTTQSANNVRYLYNDPVKDINAQDHQMSDELLAFIKEKASLQTDGKNEVTILTPYFFPTDEEMGLLKELTDKGVQVKLITNSLKSTDSAIVHAGYESIKDQITKMGIEIYEYNGPETTHAKTILINRHYFFIGSFNFDQRSSRVNREIGITMGDPNNLAFGEELGKVIDGFQDNSLLVAKGGKSVNEDLQAIRDREIPPNKVSSFEEAKFFKTFLSDDQI